MRRLLFANAALAILLAGHVADHVLRQPAAQQPSLLASLPGLFGVVAVFAALVIVAREHRHAPLIAGVVGMLTALGFVAIHLVPRWSMFSDPYTARYLDTFSWVEMLAALSGGLLVAFEARRLVKRQALSVAVA